MTRWKEMILPLFLTALGSACMFAGASRACSKACKMGVDPVKTPNSCECIRCGDCVRACPKGAIKIGFMGKKKTEV